MVNQRLKRIQAEIRGLQDDLGDLLVANFAAESAEYSATLATSWTRTPLEPTPIGFKVTVQTPLFWANILDKGRPAVSPTRALTLVWYKNPLEDDPRLANGYYTTLQEAKSRRLSSEQFQADRRAGKIITAQVSRGTTGAGFVQKARAQFRRDSIDILKFGIRASIRRQNAELSGEFRAQVTF